MPALPVPTGAPSALAPLAGTMYRSFSFDPLPQDALTLALGTGTTSAQITISGATLTLSATGGVGAVQAQYNLAAKADGTIPQLSDVQTWVNAQALGGTAAVTAALATGAVGTTGAMALTEGTFIVGQGPLPIATSWNYLLFRLLALALDMAGSDMANLRATATLLGASGLWVDWIGGLYGVLRITNPSTGQPESDAVYKRRIMVELSQPWQNNVAIANLVYQLFGAPVTINNDGNGPGLFYATFGQQPNLAQYSYDQIIAIINRYKAPGTKLSGVHFFNPTQFNRAQQRALVGSFLVGNIVVRGKKQGLINP